MKRKQASGSQSPSVSSDNSESDIASNDIVDDDKIGKIKRKKRKFADRKLYKPPTASELNNLKETDSLFHSSLFQLQTIELLKEIKLKSKWRNYFDKWMTNLTTAIRNIPVSAKFDINDSDFLTDRNITLPFSRENRALTGVFQFVAPTVIEPNVTYMLGVNVGPLTTVDVTIEIPKSFWQHNDFLNYRYFLKRAQYLSYIAINLNGRDFCEELSYHYLNGDRLRPVLLLKPCGKVGKHFTVRLIPIPEPNSFKLNRFIPQRNNVRPSWFFGESTLSDDIPTPQYNLSILNDLRLTTSDSTFVEAFKDSEGIKDAILMLKVWLHQRSLDFSFHQGIVMLLLLYLLKTRKIFKLMSSYQILRSCYIALSQSSWDVNGLLFSEENSDSSLPALVDFHNAYDVVFLDITGYFNVCGHLSLGTYQSVKHEATLAIDLLNSSSVSSFDCLFMKPVPFHLKFDHLILLTKQSEWRKGLKKLNLNNNLLDSYGSVASSIKKSICGTLRDGLGHRAFVIAINESTPSSWRVSEKPPASEVVISIGILLNQESCNNALEKGPIANTLESEKFRSFWGDKANLRRFQDGTICEAVLWEADSLAAQRRIPEQITKYLLQRFFNITSLKYINSQFDSILSIPNVRLPKEFQAYGTGEEASLAVIRSYDSLSRQLRKLELPLTISAIQGISPVFRYAEVFPPLPNNFKCKLTKNYCALVNITSSKCPTFVPITEVMIQLENSGKWPENLDALRRVKSAFYLKISELLSKHYYLTTNPSLTYVDVVKDGFVFRLIIACKKEINLMNQFKTADGMIKNRITEESLRLECRTESLTQLTSALHGLQQQHSLFSPICRLAKRWISAQLMSGHIPEIVTELLVAHQLLQPYPYIQPGSVITGFLRFLSFIATFDWKTNVLILNFNENFNKDEQNEIQSWFTTNRTTLPPMCIVTPYEKHRSIWSWNNPSGVILNRLTLLAKASLDQLSCQINNSERSDYKKIFRPPLDVYDIVIFLNNEQNPKLCFSIDVPTDTKLPDCENYLRSADEVMPVVDYDPVSLFIRDLKAAYGNFCLFFHDTYGGNYIGVIWKPKAFESRPFKVSSVNSRKPTESSIDGVAVMVPDVESILEDFVLLGSGLVKSVKTKSEKWTIN